MRFNELAVAFAVLGFGGQIAKIGNAAGAISQQRAAHIKVPMLQPFTIARKGEAEGVWRRGVDAIVNARIRRAVGRAKNRGMETGWGA